MIPMNRLYCDSADGRLARAAAWRDVHGPEASPPDETVIPGRIVYVGRNAKGQSVYWTTVGRSRRVLENVWISVWALYGQTLANWEILDVDETPA